MIHEVILRGLGVSARIGSAVPARRAARCFADDLLAAGVAARLDRPEQPGAADLALRLGEAGIEVCLEGIQDVVGLALAGGGQQLVEVGVAKATHGLAVGVQPTADGADRPAFPQQAVDVLVAVVGAFDDLGAGQCRGR
ncbi:hypothetical protein ACIRNU_32895 [Streptomyces rochei]|uniref:hypothetical protein n=1 Tax=Streptomyces rochei TaxID=1928 RepID=UPI00381F8390